MSTSSWIRNDRATDPFSQNRWKWLFIHSSELNGNLIIAFFSMHRIQYEWQKKSKFYYHLSGTQKNTTQKVKERKWVTQYDLIVKRFFHCTQAPIHRQELILERCTAHDWCQVNKLFWRNIVTIVFEIIYEILWMLTDDVDKLLSKEVHEDCLTMDTKRHRLNDWRMNFYKQTDQNYRLRVPNRISM